MPTGTIETPLQKQVMAALQSGMTSPCAIAEHLGRSAGENAGIVYQLRKLTKLGIVEAYDRPMLADGKRVRGKAGKHYRLRGDL